MKNILSLCLETTLKFPNFEQKKKKLIIKKKGIYFLLRKVYIVLPEDLQYLVQSKNYIYIYFPIKYIYFPFNRDLISDTQENNYKLLFSKEELLEEVKLFLGIENDSKNFKFDIYDEKLNVITNDSQLIKNIKNIKTIINNIIYVKIIKLNDKKRIIRKEYSYNNKRYNFIMNKIKDKGIKSINLNSKNKSINNFNYLLFDRIAYDKEKTSCNKKNNNCLSCSRNKKLNEELKLIDSYRSNSKKINKNTSTNDLVNKVYNITNRDDSKNKYSICKSNTTDYFFKGNKKINLVHSKNKDVEKYKKYMNNKISNLSTPEYYQNLKKNNTKININNNNELKFQKKKNPFFNNLSINNIFIKNRFNHYYHGNEFVNLLTNKYISNNNSLDKDDRNNLTSKSLNSFKIYLHSNIKNLKNRKLNKIYLNKGLHSCIHKNKNNIHLNL